MSDSDPSSIVSTVRNQAIRWMVCLQSGDATTADRYQLDLWLAEHPSHKQEFERLARMWSTLDGTKPLLKAELSEAQALWDQHHSTNSPASRLPLWQWSRLPITATALAVCLLVTCWWWLTQPPAPILYQTAKGEQREVALADGSVVTLNTDTKIAVRFSERTRFVRLDKGEAWFMVTHDERRPFHVQVANGAIRDIGTQFIVNKSADKVQVSVLEGIVEVGLIQSGDAADTHRPMLVHQGEQVWYGPDGHLSDIGSFNQSTVGAWKEGKLIFQAQPLAEVLTEVARYRSDEIRLLDTNLPGIPVSGSFDIKNLESFPQALEDALPIHATRVNSQLTIVEPAPAAPKKSRASGR